MTVIISILFIVLMGWLHRQTGNNFGTKSGLTWVPEPLFALPFGIALGYSNLDHGLVCAITSGLAGFGVSWAGVQSGTWPTLPWDMRGVVNKLRKATLRPIADFIANRFDIEFDSEAYAWLYTAMRGFIIGLPVGALPMAILYTLANELGSHAVGRTEKYGIDPHAVREFLGGCAGAVAILIYLAVTHG